MNEITHALFYGIEEYINDFKSCVTRAGTFQSRHECLCVHLGKFRWISQLFQSPMGTASWSWKTKRGLLKYLKMTFNFQKCNLQCELLFIERLSGNWGGGKRLDINSSPFLCPFFIS